MIASIGPIDTPMLRVFVARPDQKSTAGMDAEDLVRVDHTLRIDVTFVVAAERRHDADALDRDIE